MAGNSKTGNDKNKKRKVVTVTFPLELIDRINKLPRSVIPNKSKIMEELMENWVSEREKELEIDRL